MANRRWPKILLAVEAALCLLLPFVLRPAEGAFATACSFPFAQLGALLRMLSLSGALGNAVAWLLYAGLCLAPLACFLRRRKKGRGHGEDALLPLLSALLFAVMYLMINPAALQRHFGSLALGSRPTLSMGLAGLTFYAVAAAYLALRLLRAQAEMRQEALLNCLDGCLFLLAALLVYTAFGAGIGALRSAFGDLAAGNTGLSPSSLRLSYIFLCFQWLVDSLPALSGVAIVFAAFRLTASWRSAPYGQAVVDAAQGMERSCRRAIAAILLGQAALNVFQLALGGRLHSSDYTLSLPLLALLLLLALMLLARHLEGARQLKEENDSII